MALVVDVSVALKWILPEADSPVAERLARSGIALLVPDFCLNEACNVLWVQVRRRVFSPEEALHALRLLHDQIDPTPTAELRLHEVALEIGLAVGHSTYDTLYVAFAIAMGAEKVVAADAQFVRAMRRHPDPALSGIVLALEDWQTHNAKPH